MQTKTQIELSKLISATQQKMEMGGYAASTIKTYDKAWQMMARHAVKKTSPYIQATWHMIS
jgi:hypothetical protein